jgi:hypothetical protein
MRHKVESGFRPLGGQAAMRPSQRIPGNKSLFIIFEIERNRAGKPGLPTLCEIMNRLLE